MGMEHLCQLDFMGILPKAYEKDWEYLERGTAQLRIIEQTGKPSSPFQQGIHAFGSATRSNLDWLSATFGQLVKYGVTHKGGAQFAFSTIQGQLPNDTSELESRYARLGHLFVGGWLARSLAYGPEATFFKIARRACAKAFGGFGPYVHARLSTHEVVDNIVQVRARRDPQAYLCWAATVDFNSQHHLRFRIMCHRLGIKL